MKVRDGFVISVLSLVANSIALLLFYPPIMQSFIGALLTVPGSVGTTILLVFCLDGDGDLEI
jgi:hypothetical protein